MLRIAEPWLAIEQLSGCFPAGLITRSIADASALNDPRNLAVSLIRGRELLLGLNSCDRWRYAFVARCARK
jgi:hypothetical protein